MAYFARIDEFTTVLEVLSVPNTQQHRGQEFLADDLGLGGTWLQTSYNSRGGKRYQPGTNQYLNDDHFRYNYASPGFTYDPVRDAFIPPKPHPDAVLDEATCLWVIPEEVLIDILIPADLTE